MSRHPARVTQKEVENAVRGFEAAGKRVAEMRVLPDGTIIVSSAPLREDDAAYGASVLDERLRSLVNGRD